ncbi:leucine-rich repeat and fibronectin type III domain-containing protein 1 [Schistocerca serialis cubense]|uniref:leucine-rich repeat and fibronectin type III domain-containing protein 1 n=1 Tax=Schistocerca serialis cubense TaxID=2023355 RepID=UPI00214ED965|nr:leucine-rich repeat and fibronectin type III domain-containing protein 1 [Schistocerca serialis cubense]
MLRWPLLVACCGLLLQARPCVAQCPWSAQQFADLSSGCVCAFNSAQELSVQCDGVDWARLVRALSRLGAQPLDLLYVTNSSVAALQDGALAPLSAVRSLQISGCGLRTVAPDAFRGHETVLRNLNLQDNELGAVPSAALSRLSALTHLDLSRNRLAHVPAGALEPLSSLATLRLADNANVTLAAGALRGLGASLRNLNLRGARLRHLPADALAPLRSLAFLDLSHNAIRELPPGGVLSTLDSLAALNLERNLIQQVAPDAFAGVNDTLTSLSLLNNLLTDFPAAAISTLGELRVLDLGFNLVAELPADAFSRTPALTLLALDGNPLRQVAERVLAPLAGSLRGLSLGGRALRCDCRLRWLARWLRSSAQLQLTSRERDPQFCGSPHRLRNRSFVNIRPEELTCSEDNELEAEAVGEGEGEATPVKSGELDADAGDVTESPPRPPAPTTTTTTTTTTIKPSSTTKPKTVASTKASTIAATIRPTSTSIATTTTTSTTTTTTTAPRPTTTTTRARARPPAQQQQHSGSVVVTRSSTPPPPSWRRHPPLILATTPAEPAVVVRSASRQDGAVVISWDSRAADIPGFRVVYRLFGDRAFKQGPPLELSEREFKIKNVPPQECIVVCVVSLSDVTVTPETVPAAQCREVRTAAAGALPGNMDKITIAASAAICATVVVALVVFVAASRRRSRQLRTLHGGKAAGRPASPQLPHPPLSSLAALASPAAAPPVFGHKEWDQGSVYSGRSIPRPRAYHLDRQGSLTAGCATDEVRSHASHFSTGKGGKSRSVADGQSQHSFSNHSASRYPLAPAAYSSGLVSSRPELRQSRQSLAATAMTSDRASGAHMHGHSHAHAHRGQASRPRTRSRDRSGVVTSSRPGSRYGSTHTLSNYCADPSDNWTDHDMDIYMARNPTTRGGLVPL